MHGRTTTQSTGKRQPWWTIWQRTRAIGERGSANPDAFPEEHFNQDGGLEVPFCWTAMKRRRERGTTLTDL